MTKWYRLQIGKFEFRTNNKGFWIGISYWKKDGWLRDITISFSGITKQDLPF